MRHRCKQAQETTGRPVAQLLSSLSARITPADPPEKLLLCAGQVCHRSMNVARERGWGRGVGAGSKVL